MGFFTIFEDDRQPMPVKTYFDEQIKFNIEAGIKGDQMLFFFLRKTAASKETLGKVRLSELDSISHLRFLGMVKPDKPEAIVLFPVFVGEL